VRAIQETYAKLKKRHREGSPVEIDLTSIDDE